ncbi:MAG TPA: ABC transporter ATP-binding protein [Acidimicrobiia bacterium]|nr:ABC transporter ATP-binding protein [Acidimicrobiia bacterium]
MEPLLVASGVGHGYGSVSVLSGVDLEVHPEEVVGVAGRSGSGKSTLLHILAGLIVPVEGWVNFDGRRIDSLPELDRALIRLGRFGFVFQSSGLVPEFTALENVELPGLLLGWATPVARARAMALLEELEVADQASKRLAEMSGGQYQRVAVARALVHSPDVVFADEPTGSLDETSADLVLSALLESSKRRRAAVVIISHDREVTRRTDTLLTLRNGRLW